jgi:hypothetical protein
MQGDALSAVLERVGWVQNVIVNKTTGHVVDGHLRVALALRHGVPSVPVVYVELEPAEELAILATFDPISALAGADDAILDELLSQLAGENADLLAGIFDVADEPGGAPTGGGDEPDTPDYVPDAIFPSDNEFEVPSLDVKLQARHVELPLHKWGDTARTARLTGTYHFYTDDYKFNAIWADPNKIVSSGVGAIVEPNCSTNDQMPTAVGLFRIYQKRWIARYVQSFGIRVFVDLNVSDKFRAHNMLGVPKGWTAYATRGLDGSLHAVERDYELAREHAGADPLFLVVGGSRVTKELCATRGWHFVPELMHQRDGRLDRDG